MRRNLLVAQALAASPLRPTILLVAEAREAGGFSMPASVDCVTLPGLRKGSDGCCTPRSLPLSLREVVALRAEIIRTTLRAYAPDVLIVDHLARGALGELQPALAALRADARTRCVLGLRDVLEAPSAVRREWTRWRTAAAIRAYYDAVWVYGDQSVYDLTHEYRLPDSVAARLTYTGYLDSRRRLECEITSSQSLFSTLGIGDRRVALCLVGGGQDGGPLAEAFLRASLSSDMVGVLVTGPYMLPDSRSRVRALASSNPGFKVLDTLIEPTPLLDRADCVVAMGGYNSVCDVLSFGKRALIVPRGLPRREQQIRAERLGARGAFQVLDPRHLTPAAIASWVSTPQSDAVLPRIDLGGLSRIPVLLEAVLASDRKARALLPAGRTA
jgi:predicted glycosyltransferase